MNHATDDASVRLNGAAQATSTFIIRNIRCQEGLARFAGDLARYRHWLLEFVGHGPSAVRQIRAAVDSGAQADAIKLAHALKGRTGMLGMVELHSIAQTLELALRNEEPSAFWLDELERTTDEMVAEIAGVLGDAPH